MNEESESEQETKQSKGRRKKKKPYNLEKLEKSLIQTKVKQFKKEIG